MGARQSKRSVDITTTPKKEGAEEQQQPLDGRLGHIEEGDGDVKPAANGAPTLSSTDIQEEVIQNGSEQVVDEEIETAAQTPEAEGTITEVKEKEDNKTKKEKKEKVKKKWSFRSISFSRKDKSKPQREDKNGDVTKEEVAEVNEEKIEASEAEAPTVAAPATNEEADSHAANDNEITEKKEEIVAAEVETKTGEPAAVEVPPPEQVKESDSEQQASASSLEATAPASIPASEEVPPPLPASPPPTEVETATITEPQKVAEVVAQAEPKDTIDIPGIAVQQTSPIPTPKVEQDVVAKIEQPLTPSPAEGPKTEDVEIPEPVAAQEPALVVEEKTEALIQAVEPVPLVPQTEDQVPAATETPAQIEPEPVQASDVKTPETQESVQASNETAQSPTVQTAVEE